MSCEVKTLEDGTTLIICSRGRQSRPKCIVCGRLADFLCDYSVGNGKTCDANLCGQCRINMGVKDYCPTHGPLAFARARKYGHTVVTEDDGYPD